MRSIASDSARLQSYQFVFDEVVVKVILRRVGDLCLLTFEVYELELFVCESLQKILLRMSKIPVSNAAWTKEVGLLLHADGTLEASVESTLVAGIALVVSLALDHSRLGSVDEEVEIDHSRVWVGASQRQLEGHIIIVVVAIAFPLGLGSVDRHQTAARWLGGEARWWLHVDKQIGIGVHGTLTDA